MQRLGALSVGRTVHRMHIHSRIHALWPLVLSLDRVHCWDPIEKPEDHGSNLSFHDKRSGISFLKVSQDS